MHALEVIHKRNETAVERELHDALDRQDWSTAVAIFGANPDLQDRYPCLHLTVCKAQAAEVIGTMSEADMEKVYAEFGGEA